MFGQSKPGGMEMMISAILKSLGVSPDVLTATIEQFKSLAGQFVAAMQQINARMANIEQQNAEILALLRQRPAQLPAAPVGVTDDGSGNSN